MCKLKVDFQMIVQIEKEYPTKKMKIHTQTQKKEREKAQTDIKVGKSETVLCSF